ncbi:unnamed protein product [Psylliodes chrysocephalus]|uniref:Hexosyltransferase n=1 Tax=Psylliodes chrysocephalus TaxID=3402493 RepID=A0A9P0CTU0_9CUCU|nr:unnamed protein product [Psylliodes chrysocephala]
MLVPTRKLSRIVLVLISFTILYIFGVHNHLFEINFYEDFHYPYDGNIEPLVEQLKNNLTPDVPPINSYNFKYYRSCAYKCNNVKKLKLVYIIKSAPENINKRIGIRQTWGYEKRFSDVEIRTVFLVGETKTKVLEQSLDEEYRKFTDVIRANFTDSYYNNTLKTMMGLQWVNKYCLNSEFYMFVDDDYYVSTKNVLRFLRHPKKYPDYVKELFVQVPTFLRTKRELSNYEENISRLYAGYVFQSSPHRHFTSKWYVSLEEYPYHKWPPYVTAGAYVLSKHALIDMYYTSFYTKHFRFDDIYIGLLAYKAKIEPLNCDEFHFYKLHYNKLNFKYVIASHGYGDPQELLQIWTEQKSLGNA